MLREAAEDVAHEIFLFGVACQEAKHRLAYQAWYILARNLIDFFDTLPDDRSNDAVLAGDYFHPPGTWHAKREAIPRPSDYAAYRFAAHKRAAHLTYARAQFRNTATKPYNPSAAISNYLLALATVFLNSLLPEQQAWFRATGFPFPWEAA